MGILHVVVLPQANMMAKLVRLENRWVAAVKPTGK